MGQFRNQANKLRRRELYWWLRSLFANSQPDALNFTSTERLDGGLGSDDLIAWATVFYNVTPVIVGFE